MDADSEKCVLEMISMRGAPTLHTRTRSSGAMMIHYRRTGAGKTRESSGDTGRGNHRPQTSTSPKVAMRRLEASIGRLHSSLDATNGSCRAYHPGWKETMLLAPVSDIYVT